MMSTSPIIASCASALTPQGFEKRRNTFRRRINDFWQVIDFQKGAHGGDYFFINLGVHPIGMPLLRTGPLYIPSPPEEYECAIRQRVEQACPEQPFMRFREGPVSYADTGLAVPLSAALSTRGVDWLNSWSTFERLAAIKPEEASHLLTVVPLLKPKAMSMLALFAQAKLRNYKLSQQAMNEYLAAPSGGHSFVEVDEFLRSSSPAG